MSTTILTRKSKAKSSKHAPTESAAKTDETSEKRAKINEADAVRSQIEALQKKLKPLLRETPAFDPREAGRQAVMQMQQADGGAWTGAELEAHFGLTSATLHKRRTEHRIVWWRDAKNRFHYPKWQFNDAGALLLGVQEVLQTFSSSDEWRVMRYFLGSRGQLADRTPLDLLLAGEVEKVVAHARLHAEENTW